MRGGLEPRTMFVLVDWSALPLGNGYYYSNIQKFKVLTQSMSASWQLDTQSWRILEITYTSIIYVINRRTASSWSGLKSGDNYRSVNVYMQILFACLNHIGHTSIMRTCRWKRLGLWVLKQFEVDMLSVFEVTYTWISSCSKECSGLGWEVGTSRSEKISHTFWKNKKKVRKILKKYKNKSQQNHTKVTEENDKISTIYDW